MRKIFTYIYELVVGQEIINLVTDLRINPSRYKVNNYSSPVRVYRDDKFLLWAFDSGDIKLLGTTYTGFKARMIHKALCYAMMNGCEVE
nr:MAG TPA: hypothetical protein [Caudoviricetes sp.]